MILSEVIQSQNMWDSDGIHCTDEVQYRRFHKFLREAVLDRHIPHYRAIGVSFMKSDKSIKRLRSFVNIEGNDSVGESYPELMLNLQDKVFTPVTIPTKDISVYNCTAASGRNTFPNVAIVDANNTSVSIPVLYTKPDLCEVMNDAIIMQIHCYYSCKFMDMSKTSRLLSKSTFPFYVDYCLQDYVRVLPPRPDVVDNVVRIRFYNGMTKERFIHILTQWESALHSMDFGTEEKLWLQHSEH